MKIEKKKLKKESLKTIPSFLGDPPSRSVHDRLGAKVQSPKKNKTETRENSPRTSRPCKYFLEGHCNKGKKCNFAHETSGNRGNYVQIDDENDDEEENFDDYTPTTLLDLELEPVPIPENRSFVVRDHAEDDDDIQEI